MAMPAVTPSEAAMTGLDNWSVTRFINTSLGEFDMLFIFAAKGEYASGRLGEQNA